MLKNKLITILVLGSVWLMGCSPRPSYVLSDSEMADVLFDLNLAEQAINDHSAIFAGDSARKQQLLLSIFDKHHITQQDFDTSLVWYNAHLEEYLEINKQLSTRYSSIITGLQANVDRLKRAAEAEAAAKDKKEKAVLPPNYVLEIVRDTLRFFPTKDVLPIDTLACDSDTLLYYLPETQNQTEWTNYFP
ncbi:hypothetical protein AGMMS49982_09670 [Bacteroidia bacterium]|nr:hypothetical protein AGMMS49982_09670 [Bacteroidia bacterium]